MRDVDERDADLALQALQLDLHLLAQLQVERAERLVEQQHRRPVHERTRQRDALALPAAELARPAVLEAGERHHVSISRAALAVSAFATFCIRRPNSTFSATLMCGNSA